MEKIKSSIAIIMTMSLLLLCTACMGAPIESENVQKQEETTTEATTITEITIQKPLSELGFYDLNEMGDMLIEINGYDFSGDDPYVYYKSDYSGKIWEFRNGYCFLCKIDDDNKIVSNEIIGNYTIVDNDTVYLTSSNEGNGTLVLSDRRTFLEFNTVIFSLMNNGYEDGWLIPYSAIDWEKGFCEVEREEYSYGSRTQVTYFKLYLKK